MTALPPLRKPAAERRADTGVLKSPLRRTGRVRTGAALALAVVGLAIIGPALAPHAPGAFVGVPNSGPIDGAPFGTDALGRDVLSRFLSGGRTILLVATLATLLGVAAGALLGLLCAVAPRRIDEPLMRANDGLLAIPQLVLVLLGVSALGPQLWLITVLVALANAPRVARVIRGAALEVAARDFVLAAEAAGESRRRIATHELLPNVSGQLLVEVGLRLTVSIALVASLGFLGLGLQPPAADWGLMINENRLALAVQPWGVLLPVIAIGALTVGVNLAADGYAQARLGRDGATAPSDA